MQKFPMLEQMRAQRLRREAEITEPYRAELSSAAKAIAGLTKTLRTIERTLGTEIGKRALDHVSEMISRKIMEVIHVAVAKAKGFVPGQLITLAIPSDVIMFSDPRSIESEVLRRYTRETLPSLSLGVCDNPAEMANASVTVIDIRVPQLGFRQALHN